MRQSVSREQDSVNPLHDVADVLKRLYLSHAKPHAKLTLDCDNEVDVGERIPIAHVIPLGLHGQRDGVVR